MKKKSYKVLPILSSQRLKCCICMENKKEYIQCTNEKCTDGVICLKCLKHMTQEQKDICQICRKKMNVFHNVDIKQNSRQRENIDVLDTLRRSEIYMKGVFGIIFGICGCMLLFYFVGLIFMHVIFKLNIEDEMRSTNPFIYIILGGVTCAFVLIVCFSMCYLKKK